MKESRFKKNISFTLGSIGILVLIFTICYVQYKASGCVQFRSRKVCGEELIGYFYLFLTLSILTVFYLAWTWAKYFRRYR